MEGSGIWVEGVALAPAVRACGMWKEEEDGGRNMKEGRGRGGGGATSKE